MSPVVNAIALAVADIREGRPNVGFNLGLTRDRVIARVIEVAEAIVASAGSTGPLDYFIEELSEDESWVPGDHHEGFWDLVVTVHDDRYWTTQLVHRPLTTDHRP